MKHKTFLSLVLVLVMLIGFSEASATTLFDFKKYADEYVVSQVGHNYFNKNFEYLGDKPYPEDTPDSNLRIVQYTHKVSVGDYNQDIIVTVWFNFKDGNWNVGNGYNTNSEELPNCVIDATKCMPFQITKERAIEVAKNSGAFDSADKYTVKIHFFYGNINSYVWDITTYKSALNGKAAIISLSTGSLLVPVADWQVSFAKPEYKDAISLTNKQTQTTNNVPIENNDVKIASSNTSLYLIIGGVGFLFILFLAVFLLRKKKN